VISDQDFRDRLRAARNQLPTHILAALREAHDAYDFGCSAHSEGLDCCLDWLVADGPELHQVSRVAANLRERSTPNDELLAADEAGRANIRQAMTLDEATRIVRAGPIPCGCSGPPNCCANVAAVARELCQAEEAAQLATQVPDDFSDAWACTVLGQPFAGFEIGTIPTGEPC
jgi:hypothetical protein